MMTVAKNFSLKEMLATSTGLPNFPETWEILDNLADTARKLQMIRDRVGFPVKVTSGYRTKAVNKAVGGVATSAHVKGLAADIKGSSAARNTAIYNACLELMDKLNIDQLISYRKVAGDARTPIMFIHVGFCEGTPRKQVLVK